MNIGEKTISKMKEMASEVLDTYATKINIAFLKAGDEKLKISVAYDISISKTVRDSVDLDATISFTAEKIKDKLSTIVTENKLDLPGLK